MDRQTDQHHMTQLKVIAWLAIGLVVAILVASIVIKLVVTPCC